MRNTCISNSTRARPVYSAPGFFISTHHYRTIPMIPIIPLILRIRFLNAPLIWLRRKRNQAGKVVFLPVAAAFMALSSCNDESATKPVPQVTVTDTTPVGDGITVLAFAILGSAVVVVLGRLLR
jgi:hypothetical protein